MLPQQSERLDPRLPALLRAAPGGATDFLVYLPDQADLSAAYAIADWNERGRFVYETLIAQAARAQQPIRQWLAAHSIPHRSLWIVNALLVHGSLADAQALAARGDVALVRANTASAQPLLPPAAQHRPVQPGSARKSGLLEHPRDRRRSGLARLWYHRARRGRCQH